MLIESDSGIPLWRHVANADKIDHPELSIAYAVAQLLVAGLLEGLRRCQPETCRNLFIGRPDAKWCSKNCGSKYRVTKKRKKEIVD